MRRRSGSRQHEQIAIRFPAVIFAPRHFAGIRTKILAAEMAKHNLTYAQMVEKLKAVNVAEDERNLRNKVSRGKFTAAFLLQCLSAMETHTVHLDG